MEAVSVHVKFAIVYELGYDYSVHFRNCSKHKVTLDTVWRETEPDLPT